MRYLFDFHGFPEILKSENLIEIFEQIVLIVLRLGENLKLREKVRSKLREGSMTALIRKTKASS